MPTPRQVRDSFQDILHQNEQVLRELEVTLGGISLQRRMAAKHYDELIDGFISQTLDVTNPALLAKLGSALGTDYAGLYQKKKDQSDRAAGRLNLLTEQNGAPLALHTAISWGEFDLSRLKTEKSLNDSAQAKININGINLLLKTADDFNRAYKETGKPLLQAGSADYFSSKKGIALIWAWMTDSHYRTGRNIIKSLKRSGKDVVLLQQERVAAQQEQEQLRQSSEKLSQKIDAMSKSLGQQNNIFARMNVLSKQIQTEQDIIGDIKQQALKSLEDKSLFAELVTAFADTLPTGIVEARGKMESYQKLEQALEARMQNVKNASSKLETPMSKLNRAVSKGSYKNINIDLQDIDKKFSTLREQTSRQTREIGKIGASVRDYRLQPVPRTADQPVNVTPGYDPLSIYMQLMILDMLTSHHHDLGMVNATLGTPDANVLQDLGMDTSGLDSLHSADNNFNVDTDSLSTDFNSVSTDDLNVPDVNVPDVNVPDINIDTSSFDSGSFDSGGGFDGGGFDGGGGGGGD